MTLVMWRCLYTMQHVAQPDPSNKDAFEKYRKFWTVALPHSGPKRLVQVDQGSPASLPAQPYGKAVRQGHKASKVPKCQFGALAWEMIPNVVSCQSVNLQITGGAHYELIIQAICSSTCTAP